MLKRSVSIKYLTNLISGRINRIIFLKYQLISLFCGALALFLFITAAFSQTTTEIQIFLIVITLILFILMKALFLISIIKRLHDLNLSGWYSTLILIPGVLFIGYFFLLLMPSKQESNIYGDIQE